MKTTTKHCGWQILVWLLWLLFILSPSLNSTLPIGDQSGLAAAESAALPHPAEESVLLEGVVLGFPNLRLLFPWWPRFRWRKWALLHYQAWQRRLRRARWAYRKAVWLAHLARLALSGLIPFALVIRWLSRVQLRHQVGAIPVLHAVLEVLDVRKIINQYCPKGQAEVDYGAVALVLIINRLVAPCALSRIPAWLKQTILPELLGIPACKFNKDRIARTLDRLEPHLEPIWYTIVDRAIDHFGIDLSVVFHDLTAFVVHGEYKDSQLAEFGFAHNTPMDKRKFKQGLNTVQDGHFPADYRLYAGNTADVAAVEPNLERLVRLRNRHCSALQQILVVGDRANLNDELAFRYDQYQKEHRVFYLSGLEARKKAHQELLTRCPDQSFYDYPLQQEGYYGLPCMVTFELQEKRKVIDQTTHRGLIVLSQPMQRAKRRARARQLRALRGELAEVQARIGKPHYRTIEAVQARADTRLRNSPVGKFMEARAYEQDGQIHLRWRTDRLALVNALRRDGRYLLVTNHPTLTSNQMLALYRGKDGGEKRFTVCKSDLLVSPIYLHLDRRIESLMLLHMLALLTYSVLERQARQQGLSLTTRKMIATLKSLTIIETHCWDGSVLAQWTPIDEEQRQLLQALGEILQAMRWPRLRPTLPAVSPEWIPPGLSPGPPGENLENLLPWPIS